MTEKWVPVVNTARCTGCRAGVEACAPKCLEIRDGVAVLARPDDCGSEEHCIAPYPEQAIRMAWRPLVDNHRTGLWRSNPFGALYHP